MRNMLRKGLAFGLGLAVTSKEQIEKTVDDLVKKGEIAPEESKKVMNQMLERGEEERTKLVEMIREQVREMLNEVETASKDDIDEIREEIQALENRISALEEQIKE